MGFFKKIFGKKENNKSASSNIPQVGKDEKTLEEVSSQIFPYFKQFIPSNDAPSSLPENIADIDTQLTYDTPDIKLVFQNVCEDLNCLYVIDNEVGYEIIQAGHLEKWNIDVEKLHEIAVANFRTLIMSNMTARGDTNAIMFVVNGNLEAGLVLIDEIWEQLEEQMGENVIITVPSRDVIIATSKSNRTMIDQLSEKSRQILLEGDHPLSKNWFIRENGRWNYFDKILD